MIPVIGRSWPSRPHDVLRVLPLARSRYYFDPNTGQILLTEPLPARDEQGNEVTLRVRFRPLGDAPRKAAAGVQGAYEADAWQVRGAYLTRPTNVGDTVHVLSAAGEARFGSFLFGLEAAQSALHDGAGAQAPTEAGAYALNVGHKDVWGWSVAAEHRHVQPDFVAADDSLRTGIVSSLGAERTFDGRFNVSARTAFSRDDEQAPLRRETTARVRWVAGRLHPEAGFTVRDGEGIARSVSARAGVGASLARGRFNYAYEWPVDGQAPTRHSFEASAELTRSQTARLHLDLTRTDPTQPFVSTVGLGLTHALVGERATTRIRGGYELPGHTDPSEGYYVLGAATDYKVNDRHTLLFNVDHRRPLLPTKPTGFGSSIGWRYNHLERGESEWRLDFRSQGDTTKHALQWRGLHPLGERWTLRGNLLLTTDHPGGTRLRAGLGAAYRQKDSALLFHVTGDNVTGSSGPRSSVEWRIQGATRLSDKLIGNAGYALRSLSGSTTSKVNAGVTFELSERFDLLAELTYLNQVESRSGQLGGMVGVGYELFEHLWLTVGYALDNYVGFDPGGSAFARTRSGIFLQFDFAFDEWSLRRLFTKKSAPAADQP